MAKLNYSQDQLMNFSESREALDSYQKQQSQITGKVSPRRKPQSFSLHNQLVSLSMHESNKKTSPSRDAKRIADLESEESKKEKS